MDSVDDDDPRSEIKRTGPSSWFLGTRPRMTRKINKTYGFLV